MLIPQTHKSQRHPLYVSNGFGVANGSDENSVGNGTNGFEQSNHHHSTEVSVADSPLSALPPLPPLPHASRPRLNTYISSMALLGPSSGHTPTHSPSPSRAGTMHTPFNAHSQQMSLDDTWKRDHRTSVDSIDTHGSLTDAEDLPSIPSMDDLTAHAPKGPQEVVVGN
jgi:hypothetical protein